MSDFFIYIFFKNKSLVFLPTNQSFDYKNSERYFTVIDYSECKSHIKSQFTFKVNI